MSDEELFKDDDVEVTKDKLETISKLCHKQISLEDKVEALKEQLRLTKVDLEEVSRVQIPAIFTSVNLSEIRLSDGRKVTIEDKLKSSIAKKNYMMAYRNMVNSEGGDEEATKRIDALFKSEIVISMDDESTSDKYLEILLEADIPYESKKTIHPQTLKKYCKERLEQGKEIPEGISVFQYQETKLS